MHLNLATERLKCASTCVDCYDYGRPIEKGRPLYLHAVVCYGRPME